MNHRRKLLLILVLVMAAYVGMQSGQRSLAGTGPDPTATPSPTPIYALPPQELPNPWLEEPVSGSVVYGAEIPEDHPQGPESATVMGRPLGVASGLSFSCAVFDTGKVYCWGDNQWGQLGNGTFVNSANPVMVVGLDDVVSASALHKHVCALTASGGVKCWGRNYHGELGNNSTDNRSYPVNVLGLTSGVEALTVGGFHACALLADGGIKCWGYNFHGQLGDGTFGETADRWTPVDVVDVQGQRLTGFKAVAAGKYHTCAITSSNQVQCWGYNMDGQIGDGTGDRDSDRHNPVNVVGLNNVAALALGEHHSCALLISGGVKCWGRNDEGQLGSGNYHSSPLPVDVQGLTSGVAKLMSGVTHACAVLTNGTMKCWGYNRYGQVGNNSRNNAPSPVTVLNNVQTASGGDSHTCAVSNQRIWCWGSNTYGQVGNGSSGLRYEPVWVSGLGSNVSAVATGGFHSCALLSDGGVRCWGDNTYGQLGDGTTQTRLTPVAVTGLGGTAQAIVAGGYHTCALLNNGLIRCWGLNSSGQLGNQQATNSSVPVSVYNGNMSGLVDHLTAGWFHTCAAVNGSFWCWGENGSWQLGNDNAPINSAEPSRVHNFANEWAVNLSAGGVHSCGFNSLGALKCWGSNYYGQLGNHTNESSEVPVSLPDLTSGVTAVTTGQYHSCALVNSVLQCWGFNSSGQLGDGSATNRWSPVSVIGLGGAVSSVRAKNHFTCVRLDSGGVQCWGDNGSAQLGNGTTYARSVPVNVTGLTAGVVAVDTGFQHACALTSSGVMCWGANSDGQIGDGTTPWYLTPVQMPLWYDQVLSVDFTDGQPGSYFTFTGLDYPPGVTVTLRVNSFTLTNTLAVDSGGGFDFQLHTPDTEEGYYHVSTQAAGVLRGATIYVTASGPLRPKMADDFFEIPPGLAYPYAVFLPMIFK